MLTAVLWKWGSKFQPTHVNVLAAMLRRNLSLPHRVVCITDDARGIDGDIAIVAMPGHLERYSRWGQAKRLWIYSKEFGDVAGPRFVQIDIDQVIVGDMTPLLSRTEKFIVWKSRCRNPQGYCYNPSLLMMDSGIYPEIWEQFVESPEVVLLKSYAIWGKNPDQSPPTQYLAPHAATWDTRDGIYSFRDDLNCGHRPLPKNARLVSFYGKVDPTDKILQKRCPWIQKHWHSRQLA